MVDKFFLIKENWRKIEEELNKKSETTINKLLENFPKARKAWDYLKNNSFVDSQWEMADYLVVKKMHYNAHGDTHAKVVASNSLKILDILVNKGIKPDIVKDGLGDIDDAYLIVLVSSLLHDIGNQVNRSDHNLHSVILAVPILDKMLEKIYEDPSKIGVIRSFILHAIYTHMEEERSYTLEASIVKVADGTDMTKGRSRIPYDLGNVNIHTVSALSVDEVEIVEGKDTPVEIRCYMTNSSGIFQVEEILNKKLMAGTLLNLIKIVAVTIPENIKKDERMVNKLIGIKGVFKHFSN
ncbi:MAG: HD domain-containing protein [Thermoproteales archaeon]|nr:HD domain-containing protein [Thermoproteales archaeon]